MISVNINDFNADGSRKHQRELLKFQNLRKTWQVLKKIAFIRKLIRMQKWTSHGGTAFCRSIWKFNSYNGLITCFLELVSIVLIKLGNGIKGTKSFECFFSRKTELGDPYQNCWNDCFRTK